MIGYSPKFPLELDNYVGAYSLNTTLLEVAKQNFMNVLLTSPGERLMDPDFGVGLRRYLFEPNTPTLHSSIATKIQKQVAKYTPYIRGVAQFFCSFCWCRERDSNNWRRCRGFIGIH